MNIAVFTSNYGKFEYVRRLLGTSGLHIAIFLPDSVESEETDHTQLNARTKALRGSFLTELPVLASDEELFFPHVPVEVSPGARVRRIVGPQASDSEVVEYYRGLVSALPPARRVTRIVTNYVLAQRGVSLGKTQTVQECALVVPPSPTELAGRPLASFHYEPSVGKFYSEMSDSERLIVDRPFAKELAAFLLGLL